MHLSFEQFIRLEMIEMQYEVCGPQGKGTCTFIQNGRSTRNAFARKPGMSIPKVC
jgi:hypothetical protein